MKTSIDPSQEAFVKVSMIVVIRKITQQNHSTGHSNEFVCRRTKK